jgi:hypothetical protein
VRHKKPTKKAAQERHSRERAFKRYGIELDEEKYRRLCNSIRYLGSTHRKRKYDVELIEKKSLTRSIYKVYYEDQILVVVYDKSRSSIETILPPNCREIKRHEKENKICS